MKAACLVLSGLIVIAIMAVCVMVKFATEITVEDKRLQDSVPVQGIYKFSKGMGVLTINDESAMDISERFPYVAAITRNSSKSWTFACFASVILVKWIVTSAHCRQPGSAHRVLLYYDYIRNHTHTYPILFWRKHEHYNISNPTAQYDIAVAKLNVDLYPFTVKSSSIDQSMVAGTVEASVWKTVITMDKKLFLTNDFEKFDMSIAQDPKCYESYGVVMDESLICIDMSDYEDCFVHEFGPLYFNNKLVGIMALKPRECEVKLAVFTNVSYYTNWILKTTHTTFYG